MMPLYLSMLHVDNVIPRPTPGLGKYCTLNQSGRQTNWLANITVLYEDR